MTPQERLIKMSQDLAKIAEDERFKLSWPEPEQSQAKEPIVKLLKNGEAVKFGCGASLSYHSMGLPTIVYTAGDESGGLTGTTPDKRVIRLKSVHVIFYRAEFDKVLDFVRRIRATIL